MIKVKRLVVDSGAFIKNAPVHEYAENIYTVNGAIKEIKDKATRQRLQFLPYTLKVKEPSPEAYKHVLEFSKKTGDFASLSIVDLQIIALTYQLEKENVGTNHLNTEPTRQVTSKSCFADSQLSGFYYPEKVVQRSENELDDQSNPNDDELSDEESENNVIRESETCVIDEEHDKENGDTIDEEHDKENGDTIDEEHDKENGDTIDEEHDKKNTDTIDEEHDKENADTIDEEHDKENEINEYSGDESDSEEGWITSDNIAEMQKKMGAMVLDENSTVCVACISTDFSIQNVLIQIGLHILSVDGMLIKNARVFILRCFACFKTSTDTSRKFCWNCGNKTLKRVAVSYDENGSQKIHINFRKPINIRGTKYSLPRPKGGKHAVNPVLCEDQPIPQNRPAKMALKKIDVLSPDYEALSSPFAVNDVYSRAASLGIRSNKNRHQKKNPNEWSKRTGNKKRNK